MKNNINILIFLFLPGVLFGQILSTQDIARFNKEIQFINESIHGALILHRIYEGLNQEINSHVDLPKYELNKYTNSDLPEDVFEDPENMFFVISPNQLFRQLETEKMKGDLFSESYGIVVNLIQLDQRINSHRSHILESVDPERQNDIDYIRSLYRQLEEVVEDYENMEMLVSKYELLLYERSFDNQLRDDRKQFYTALAEIHSDIKRALRQISRSQSDIEHIISKIDKENNWLKACLQQLESSDERMALQPALLKVNSTVTSLKQYLNNQSAPPEYDQFGRGYYFRNVIFLRHINRYGNGYVQELNKFFDDFGWNVIHLVEEPHFLKINYPQSLTQQTLDRSEIKEIELSDLNITTPSLVPTKVDDTTTTNPKTTPSLRIIERHQLIVDSTAFEIELYDHLIKDGDRVSINVNGKWVYEDISLEKEPQKIRLSFVPGQDNYIMVRAINNGWRPPNTVGLKYVSNGQVKNMLLKTDLSNTELVRVDIEYRP